MPATAQPVVNPQWFTVKDAATYSGLSPETIRRLIQDGKLQATYFTPRALRVSRQSLDNLAQNNRTDQWGGAA